MIKRLFKDPADWITIIGILFVFTDMIVGLVGEELFGSTATSAIGIGIIVVHGLGTVMLLREHTKENYK